MDHSGVGSQNVTDINLVTENNNNSQTNLHNDHTASNVSLN